MFLSTILLLLGHSWTGSLCDVPIFYYLTLKYTYFFNIENEILNVLFSISFFAFAKWKIEFN